MSVLGNVVHPLQCMCSTINWYYDKFVGALVESHFGPFRWFVKIRLPPHPPSIVPVKQDNAKPKTRGPGKDHEYLFTQAQKRKKAEKAKRYRQRQKQHKDDLRKQESLKWERLGGAKKLRMGAHQYEKPILKRIVQLGTCPTARGSFIPTARIASHMVNLGAYAFIHSKCLTNNRWNSLVLPYY